MKHAIEALETTTKEQGKALDAVGKDVHPAKVTMRVLVGVGIAIAGAIGWAVTTYISLHPPK